MSLSWLTCKYNMCYIQTSVTAQQYDNSMMLDKETVESKKEKEEWLDANICCLFLYLNSALLSLSTST